MYGRKRNMGTCSNGGRSSGNGTFSPSKSDETNIQKQIDDLRRELAKPFEPHGRKGWQQQLDADTKKKANIEKKINQLERQKNKQASEKKEPSNTKTKSSGEFKWQRAGDGWYVGKNGFEIRENDDGGFDVVKVSGSSEKKIKSFSKLSQARKYNPISK